MSITTPARIMVVKASGSGMEAYAYKDELDAVLMMMENGSLGRSKSSVSSWGDEAHRAAIDTVERRIASLRASFALQDAKDAAPLVECPDCGRDISVGWEHEHECG